MLRSKLKVLKVLKTRQDKTYLFASGGASADSSAALRRILAPSFHVRLPDRPPGGAPPPELASSTPSPTPELTLLCTPFTIYYPTVPY